MPPLYSRRPGLGFIHDEMADGSSRRTAGQTQRPAAAFVPGAVVAICTALDEVIPFDPTGADDARVPAGIIVASYDAMPPAELLSEAEADLPRVPSHCSVLVRRAEVIGSRITWPAGITAEQRAAAVAQLGAAGIAVV